MHNLSLVTQAASQKYVNWVDLTITYATSTKAFRVFLDGDILKNMVMTTAPVTGRLKYIGAVTTAGITFDAIHSLRVMPVVLSVTELSAFEGKHKTLRYHSH